MISRSQSLQYLRYAFYVGLIALLCCTTPIVRALYHHYHHAHQAVAQPMAQVTVYKMAGVHDLTIKPVALKAPWNVNWSFICDENTTDSFMVHTSKTNGSIAPGLPVIAEKGISGRGSEIYNSAGTFGLQVKSACDWTITVTQAG